MNWPEMCLRGLTAHGGHTEEFPDFEDDTGLDLELDVDYTVDTGF